MSLGMANRTLVSEDQQMWMRGSVQCPCLEGRGGSVTEALDKAFASVCSLLIVIIALIIFP